MDLKGKRAVVTGGGRGIGAATAVALADKGADVAIGYCTHDGPAGETAAAAREKGVRALTVRAEARDYDQVAAMMETVRAQLGGIDILVNSVGIIGENAAIARIEPEEWDRVLAVNLTGVYNCCRAAEPDLKKNKGKIVNISSIAGKMGGSIGCHYAASKAGIIGLTFALATELAPAVTVNAIAPGPVDTDLLSADFKKILAERTPFGRIARPGEIAHTVVYLLENDYVSGEVIDVNAGRYMD